MHQIIIVIITVVVNLWTGDTISILRLATIIIIRLILIITHSESTIIYLLKRVIRGNACLFIISLIPSICSLFTGLQLLCLYLFSSNFSYNGVHIVFRQRSKQGKLMMRGRALEILSRFQVRFSHENTHNSNPLSNYIYICRVDLAKAVGMRHTPTVNGYLLEIWLQVSRSCKFLSCSLSMARL